MTAHIIPFDPRQLRRLPHLNFLPPAPSGAFLLEHDLLDVDPIIDDRVTEPGVVILGLRSGRPRAARFTPADAPLAGRAAQLMGLHLLPLDTPERVALAQRLAPGLVLKTGRSFVPFCKAEVYRQLCSTAGIDPTVELPVEGDTTDEAAAGDPPKLTEALPVRLPLGWDDLGPGCLCLASEGVGHGWFAVEILEVTPEGLLVRWRDFDEAEWGRFIRQPDQLALLPPAAASEAGHAST